MSIELEIAEAEMKLKRLIALKEQNAEDQKWENFLPLFKQSLNDHFGGMFKYKYLLSPDFNLHYWIYFDGEDYYCEVTSASYDDHEDPRLHEYQENLKFLEIEFKVKEQDGTRAGGLRRTGKARISKNGIWIYI